MEMKINKLLEYFDKEFMKEKVEVDDFGRMGFHYDGLILDEYIENSVLGIDYLSVEDYFETSAGVKYNEINSLVNQYSDETLDVKLKVVSAILSLVNMSTYKVDTKENIIKKSTTFLGKLGLKVVQNKKEISIVDEKKKFEGSYSNIYEHGEHLYKKRLKDKYNKEEKWIKRFKYEYENMLKLSESTYILKVTNYDDYENSYLMEKCECNLYDYINQKPTLSDEKILKLIFELLLVMQDVHNAGILHRDLHLGNILIKDKHVILADFGLSKDTILDRSLKSTSTPKNSHYFMDPIGLISFLSLDKLSDIYSIGKIIDYITRDRKLNEKLSYVINKSVDRDRKKRYQSFKDFYIDTELAFKEIEFEEKMRKVEEDIQNGSMTPWVEEFINGLATDEKLSIYIVNNHLRNFDRLLLQLNEMKQIDLLEKIEKTYSESTGYGHFKNYDLFAEIMFRVIQSSDKAKVKKIARNILEGCAEYRYKAKDYLKQVDILCFDSQVL